MYNIYSRYFTGSIYNRLMNNPQEENYSLASNVRRSRAQYSSCLVPHEEVLGLNLGRGKQLVLFKVILIDYYKHYNKSEFGAPEIHDAALKV